MKRPANAESRPTLKVRRALLAALIAASLLQGGPAPAQGKDPLVQAKALFNGGAQAYERGQFLAAIQAFEEAYKLAPRHGILFSMAQAYRRQYFVDRRPEHLQRAIVLYRDYLQQVPEGGRRADVAQALEELEPLAARLPAAPAAQPAPGAPAVKEAKPQTRLMISSQVPGALVSIDGGTPAELPFIEEVKPGQHTVKVTAPGHFGDEREIVAAEGGVVALDIPLREKPALLSVQTTSGADVAIDGRLVGAAPLAKPIELPAGRHLVTVTLRGRKTFSTEVDLTRDMKKTVAAELPTTLQRDASLVLMGAGAVGLLAGGVLALFAVNEQNVAQAIYDQTRNGNVSADKLAEYKDAVDARGQLRSFAGAALGIGVAVGAAGALLFFTEQPSIGPAILSGDRPAAPPPAQPRREGEPAMEVSAAPILGPGFAGAAVGGRF